MLSSCTQTVDGTPSPGAPSAIPMEMLDPGAVERDVAAQFEAREDVTIDLDCPAQMPVEADATYDCTGTTEAGEGVTLRIQITDADTAAYTWTES